MISVGGFRRRLYYRLFGADAALAELVSGAGRILDVGCSDGRGSELLSGSFGCDIYIPNLRRARDTGRRSPVVCADVRRLPFRDCSFDLVTSLDVVEHFEKSDALTLLDELERVSTELVVVLTPSGFVPQPPGEDEPWQEHRCGFEAAELAERGFEVRGVGGDRRLRGAYGTFRFGIIGAVLAALTRKRLQDDPDRSFHLIGFRRVEGE